MHSVELAEDVFEGGVEAIVAENANSLYGTHLRQIPYMVRLQLFLQGPRWVFVKNKA